MNQDKNSSRNSMPHNPIMVDIVLEALCPSDNLVYIDGTFGAGGHTKAILQNANCFVHALDRDPTTIQYAKEIADSRLVWHNSRFSEMDQVMHRYWQEKKQDYNEIAGIIIDIGVSSMQLNQAERGFSFMNDGPLLMTMGDNATTAYELINELSENELALLIGQYGEEPKANQIAKAIARERKKQKIKTTKQLADLIIDTVGPKSGKIHPATLTFQALRIAVNNELYELEKGIIAASQLLAVGGTLAIISFHGLENIVIKNCFRQLIRGKEKGFAKLYGGKAIKPHYKEIKRNPRARSALFRAVRRIS